jgi:hypothetical protein
VQDRVRLRQMNMTLALAASRWNEFAESGEPERYMRAWLEDGVRRARERRADARAEAFELAHEWFDRCAERNR